MGVQDEMDSHFGRRVFEERKRRDWSQDELAKRLSDKGLPVYASTIAKIESRRKPRAVRLAEVVAIAELFEVSTDTLLGRSVSPRNDEMYVLRALLDAAQQASWQVSTIETTLRDRIAEVTAFGPDAIGKTIASGCERAADALAEAHKTVYETLNPPGSGAIAQFTRKLLIEALQKEQDNATT